MKKNQESREEKTNVCRLFEQAGIAFRTASYEVDESDLSGVHAASELGIEPELMFKTLVTRDEKNGLHVFCIPVAEELDLKKCARAAGVKNLEMIHVKELQALTGYIRGGCSPVGMKKKYPTILDETALLFDEIYISAGARGISVILSPEVLCEYLGASFEDLCK